MAARADARLRAGRRRRLAAAVIGYLWARYEPRPRFIVVEPRAPTAGSRATAPASRRWPAATPTRSMGGLACREISPVTWPVVGLATDWFMTITEDEVMPAAGCWPIRSTAIRRSRRAVGLRRHGRPAAGLHRRGRLQALHLDSRAAFF
jgi:hypothetical protein